MIEYLNLAFSGIAAAGVIVELGRWLRKTPKRALKKFLALFKPETTYGIITDFVESELWPIRQKVMKKYVEILIDENAGQWLITVISNEELPERGFNTPTVRYNCAIPQRSAGTPITISYSGMSQENAFMWSRKEGWNRNSGLGEEFAGLLRKVLKK